MLASVIRGIRKNKSISQEELSDWAGLDRNCIERIERSERNVTLLNLLRIARVLDCELAELFEAAKL